MDFLVPDAEQCPESQGQQQQREVQWQSSQACPALESLLVDERKGGSRFSFATRRSVSSNSIFSDISTRSSSSSSSASFIYANSSFAPSIRCTSSGSTASSSSSARRPRASVLASSSSSSRKDNTTTSPVAQDAAGFLNTENLTSFFQTVHKVKSQVDENLQSKCKKPVSAGPTMGRTTGLARKRTATWDQSRKIRIIDVKGKGKVKEVIPEEGRLSRESSLMDIDDPGVLSTIASTSEANFGPPSTLDLMPPPALPPERRATETVVSAATKATHLRHSRTTLDEPRSRRPFVESLSTSNAPSNTDPVESGMSYPSPGPVPTDSFARNPHNIPTTGSTISPTHAYDISRSSPTLRSPINGHLAQDTIPAPTVAPPAHAAQLSGQQRLTTRASSTNRISPTHSSSTTISRSTVPIRNTPTVDPAHTSPTGTTSPVVTALAAVEPPRRPPALGMRRTVGSYPPTTSVPPAPSQNQARYAPSSSQQLPSKQKGFKPPLIQTRSRSGGGVPSSTGGGGGNEHLPLNPKRVGPTNSSSGRALPALQTTHNAMLALKRSHSLASSTSSATSASTSFNPSAPSSQTSNESDSRDNSRREGRATDDAKNGSGRHDRTGGESRKDDSYGYARRDEGGPGGGGKVDDDEILLMEDDPNDSSYGDIEFSVDLDALDEVMQMYD